MSRYISWDDLVDRYQIAAKAKGGSNLTRESFINYAEDEVDGRLAVRYTTPFSPVPGVVKDLCIDLAYWKMMFSQPNVAKPLGAYINSRFDDILMGRIKLTVSGTVASETMERMWSTTQDFGPSFGVDPPENWAVDSSWMDDFAARRGFPDVT